MHLVRIALPALLAGVSLVGSVSAGASPAQSPACSPRITLLARGYGAPDDVALDGRRILFGDLATNVLAAESNGHVTTLARGFSVPEGIVVRAGHQAVVVEQGANRLVLVDLRSGRRRVVRTFPNGTGLEGIDSIGAAPNGGIYVPDSPHGTLYVLDRRGQLHLLASGLARPVAAVAFRGGVAVPDENAHAVWLIQQGRVQRLATLSIPDDVVVFHGRLLADTLGDGGVWEVWPSVKLLVRGFVQPQGMAVRNSGSLVVADSKSNGLFTVSNLASCL